jgi:diacylglycerol kinase family enzyme
VERRGRLKRYAGHPLFIYAAFATWFRHYDRSRPRFAVHHADGTIVDDGYLAIVLNTNPYTYLGNRPFNVAPDATLERPLAIVTIRTLDFLPFLGIAMSALASGERFRRNRLVDYRVDVEEMKLDGHGPVPYQVDGDYMGETDSLHFLYEPGALRLVRP